jgi:hypothetical protein
MRLKVHASAQLPGGLLPTGSFGASKPLCRAANPKAKGPSCLLTTAGLHTVTKSDNSIHVPNDPRSHAQRQRSSYLTERAHGVERSAMFTQLCQ